MLHINVKQPVLYKKPKILLVEDTELIQKVNSECLRSASFEVDIAGDYQEALNLYQSNNYDLILTDIGLPGKSGIELCRKIRELEQTTKNNTPILALTAFGKTVEKECYEAGATDFATKPLMQDELINFVKKWIKKGK